VQAIREARGRAGAVKSAVMTWGNKLGIDGGGEQMQALMNAGQRVDLLAPRVEVMSGPDSPVTAAFSECLAAMERVSRGATLISGAHEVSEWWTWLDDLMAGAEQIGTALDRFVAAAHAAIGLA
jgi:hypothetical protein